MPKKMGMTPEKALKMMLSQYEKDEIINMFYEFIDTFAGNTDLRDYLDAVWPDWEEDTKDI